MEKLCVDKNKRVRFTPQDDLIFLREVFTIRALREHLELLLKKFVIKDEKNKTMTGLEEPYNEMDHLLQQINEILKEIKISGLKQSITQDTSSFFAKDSIEKGKIMRKHLLEQFKKNEASELQLDVIQELPNGENIGKDLAINSTNSDPEINIVSQSHDEIQNNRILDSKIRNKTRTVLTPDRSRTPKIQR